MAKYTYSRSYTTSSPGRPYTPPYSVYSTALMSLSTCEMSSDSTSGCTSCGSGSHSPRLPSVPRCMHYNPIIGVTSMMQARCPPTAPPASSGSHSPCLLCVSVCALQPHQCHFHDTGETSSDSTFGHTSCGSGYRLPRLSSVPRCVRYNPISVISMTQARRPPTAPPAAPVAALVTACLASSLCLGSCVTTPSASLP
jgi:hypothetical protein